jgi:hypothetical protein
LLIRQLTADFLGGRISWREVRENSLPEGDGLWLVGFEIRADRPFVGQSVSSATSASAVEASSRALMASDWW